MERNNYLILSSLQCKHYNVFLYSKRVYKTSHTRLYLQILLDKNRIISYCIDTSGGKQSINSKQVKPFSHGKETLTKVCLFASLPAESGFFMGKTLQQLLKEKAALKKDKILHPYRYVKKEKIARSEDFIFDRKNFQIIKKGQMELL